MPGPHMLEINKIAAETFDLNKLPCLIGYL